MRSEDRGQSNLIAVAIAVLLLTAAIGVALTVASTPFRAADDDVVDRHVAADVAESLLAPASPVTRRAGVLNAAALRTLEVSTLEVVPADAAVRIRFDDRPIVATGPVTGGATVRRLVTVTTWRWHRTEPSLGNGSVFTVGPTPVLRLGFNTTNATIRTVRVDGRVVLHDPSGIDGPVRLDLPPSSVVTVNVSAAGPVSTGDVWVATPSVTAETGVLVVTVDG